MLVGLRLQNIALLESLELAFDKGFTVLTGETGAGKSILLDALDALFAGNHSISASRLLRDGSCTGQIEATFLANSNVDLWLEDEGFDLDDDQLVICREWRLKDQRLINRCRLNGFVVNRQQLAVLRPMLIDLTVQGQTHDLASSLNQINWLDSLGSHEFKQLLEQVKISWKNWNDSYLLLEKALFDKEKSDKEFHEFKNFLTDIEAAGLNNPDEDIQLQIEEDRLTNSVRLRDGIDNLLSILQNSHSELPSLEDQFANCIQE